MKTGIPGSLGVFCPYCGLQLERAQASRSVCPSCLGTFVMPNKTEWAALIVPFLALQYLTLFVL